MTPAMSDPSEIPAYPFPPELFVVWRSPRLGQTNPERMNNPVWESLIRNRADAWTVNQHFLGPPALEAGPGWCFDRFGQSETTLTDGRTIWVAGEHEDYYDPDFQIYNDVVVRHPDGSLDLFGYPRSIFPPTDFHTATVIGDQLLLIGSLGYPEDRQPPRTQVLRLDLKTFTITAQPTSNSSPGWLHGHQAELSGDGKTVTIRGGKRVRSPEDFRLVENIDDWCLHLDDWRWEQLTNRRWRRWEFRREDQKGNRLWEIEQVVFYRTAGWTDDLEKATRRLAELSGRAPDLATFETLHRPPLPHTVLPEIEDEYGVVRIVVRGVTVRYVRDTDSIHLTIEGQLQADVAELLTTDLLEKLGRVENTTYLCTEL